MPLSFAYLHARPYNIPVVSSITLSTTSSLVAAAQILLYRFVNASTSEDRSNIAQGIVAVHAGANEEERQSIRKRIGAKEGVFGLFERSKDSQETAHRMSSQARFHETRTNVSPCSRVDFDRKSLLPI